MLTPPLNEASAKYRIYPSLLDSYQQLLDYEIVAEEPWNKRDGDYVLTPDEMYDKIEAELIASVNREPHEPSQAADRGTCFNEIVDCLIEKRACSREDMLIRSLRDDCGRAVAIEAQMNGFEFAFDVDLCREAAAYFEGALTQQLLSAPIATNYGNVILYGYADEWIKDKIYDIKTTSYYDFGKFEHKWQRYVYPYCAIESRLTENISEFEYTVFRLNKTAPITAAVYKEAYTYDHETAKTKLRLMCESFIEWLETKKQQELIKNKRIFNQAEINE